MASKQVQLLDDGQDGEANKGVQRSSSCPPPPPPLEEGLRCPRCDSPNTKFCYYNNHSLTQPRHYCKACRRYWTRGGALRNVPVGGGCRKSKKSKSSSSYSSSTSSSAPRLGLDQLLYSSDTSNRFKFFHGFSSEFNFPYRTSSSTGQLWSYGDQSTSISSVGINGASAARGSSLLDVNYLLGNFSETATNNTNSNSRLLTSTIESLSSINQDMHWKLQQQRLGMFYGGDQDHHHHNNKETTVVSDLPSTSYLQNQNQNQNQHLPISFHMPITSESFSFASGTTPTISNAAFVGDDNGISISSDWYQKLQYL